MVIGQEYLRNDEAQIRRKALYLSRFWNKISVPIGRWSAVLYFSMVT